MAPAAEIPMFAAADAIEEQHHRQGFRRLWGSRVIGGECLSVFRQTIPGGIGALPARYWRAM
jgi:hypothetical protein